MFGRETKKMLRGALQSLDAALKLTDDTNAQLREAIAVIDKANRVADDWERMCHEATQSKWYESVSGSNLQLDASYCKWIN